MHEEKNGVIFRRVECVTYGIFTILCDGSVFLTSGVCWHPWRNCCLMMNLPNCGCSEEPTRSLTHCYPEDGGSTFSKTWASCVASQSKRRWHHGRNSATSDEGYPSVNEQGASNSSPPPSGTLSAKSWIVTKDQALRIPPL